MVRKGEVDWWSANHKWLPLQRHFFPQNPVHKGWLMSTDLIKFAQKQIKICSGRWLNTPSNTIFSRWQDCGCQTDSVSLRQLKNVLPLCCTKSNWQSVNSRVYSLCTKLKPSITPALTFFHSVTGESWETAAKLKSVQVFIFPDCFFNSSRGHISSADERGCEMSSSGWTDYHHLRALASKCANVR